MHTPHHVWIAVLADQDDLVTAENPRQHLALPLVCHGLILRNACQALA